MMDRIGIYRRFAQYHDTEYPQLAVKLGLSRKTTQHWSVGRAPVPWKYLKDTVDEHGLSWDWLLEGVEPRKRRRHNGEVVEPLDRHEINQRFLSLFPNMSQAKIAKELGLNQTTVFKWCHDMAQVPWERLKYAVDNKGVTWEWLLEGR